MSSVELIDLTKRFGAFTAVQAINLSVKHAELVALLGPSGCGKTTTMNMIAGIDSVTSGTIKFDARDVTRLPVDKRGVGYVFQNYAIFTHLSVYENLAFGLRVRRKPAAEIDRKVKEMAEFLSLAPRLGEASSGLSVNELQKLAIGRSAIVDPKIFLLDEPLSNLDAAFRERMRSELRVLQRALNQTMIYVTHDQIEAMGLADRIAVMDNAVLQQFATPREIYERPANGFVARFIGAPSMNLLRAELRHEGGRLEALLGGRPANRLILDARLAADARACASHDVLVGFRPETLSLVPDGASNVLITEIALVETIGRRRIVHFVCGTSNFIGVFDRGFRLRAGEVARVGLDLSRTLLFDAATERRLGAIEREARHG